MKTIKTTPNKTGIYSRATTFNGEVLAEGKDLAKVLKEADKKSNGDLYLTETVYPATATVNTGFYAG